MYNFIEISALSGMRSNDFYKCFLIEIQDLEKGDSSDKDV